ncbi:Intron-binding protein aquarius [Thelohanellus kitauei]|uniref:Intron-binding protein aquarius n=1 Tax=Thelohanellus kitauei TaxID=669202 RepID=A0A0C2JY18_THEKT|nr:Intron-binding protein aquarius [Thelohanellus kitauei]
MPVLYQSKFISPQSDEISKNPLSRFAAIHWYPSAKDVPFDKAIVEEVYVKYLKSNNFERRQVMILEFTRYLENYLWRFFNSETESIEHVLSIILVINEKYRSKISPWECLVNNDTFADHLFILIYRMAFNETITFRERCHIVEFFTNCINSLEVDLIRKQLQDIVSISSWTCLLPNRLDYELGQNKIYKKLYAKHTAKVKKLKNKERETYMLKSTFLSNFIKYFLDIMDQDPDNIIEDTSKKSFVHFFMFLLIELESLLSTRRFFHALFDDHHVVVHTRLSQLFTSGKDKMFIELWEILRFYSKIEIDDMKGEELNHEQLLERHYSDLTHLQRIAFTQFKSEMQEFYLLPVYRLDSRDSLIEHFGKLSDESLFRFAHHCNIVNYVGNSMDRDFVIELLTFKYERSKTLLEKVNSQSLYPDENMLWYESAIPDEDWSGDDALPLPKLNLQFLTLKDYLWRNFILFLLESTFSIKMDIEDAVSRLKPWMNELGDTQFAGWARMALPLKDFAISKVGPTDVSTSNPQYVYADLTISTRMRESFKNEWLGLRRHDPIFLLYIRFDNVGVSMHIDNIFPQKYGIIALRGAEIVGILNEEGKVVDEGVEFKPKDNMCSYRISLDPNQYQKDMKGVQNGRTVYNALNVIMRRKPKENNFKAVLETIRSLMNTDFLIPEWLGDIFLGYGDPSSAHPSQLKNETIVDFYDTFVDQQHIIQSFPGRNITFSSEKNLPFWKLSFEGENITAESYTIERSVFDKKKLKLNKLRYTPKQVEAIHLGLRNGLSLIVGPPGTGKTDVAVQIISTLFNTFPTQRTLIVTHSNQALNQIFEKIVYLNVKDMELIRLGHGEEELSTTKDFSRRGRVNEVLARRLELIQQVIDLQKSLNIEGMLDHTCETASNFFTYQIKIRIKNFFDTVAASDRSPSVVANEFPFRIFIQSVLGEQVFEMTSFDDDYKMACEYIDYIENIFTELHQYRPFELLRTVKDRSNYMVSKTCRIIAMTCVHAALKRKDLVDLRFQYDNIIMEEAAQILEIETFIPLLLQNPHDGYNRLKRIILIGDHNQLPPIIRSLAFQKYCNMEQSLFSRFIRLGVPCVELDYQGRCRPSICELFKWRYKDLKTLPILLENPTYQLANTGFLFEYQLINVENFEGQGETEPTKHFIQNLGEAEYAASLFVYMRLCGYPAEKISILTTYNGQKHLIRDIIKKKCSENVLLGQPHKISTVDRYQGQQNDYIILSLVRTKTIGYLRDVRRLVVAMSRARLGLYVLARVSTFDRCHELSPAFGRLLEFPTRLHIVTNEEHPSQRQCNSHSMVPRDMVKSFDSVVEFSKYVHTLYLSVAYQHQIEEKKLEEERKRIDEEQRLQYEAYVKQMEALAEENSKKYQTIKNEVVLDEKDAADA